MVEKTNLLRNRNSFHGFNNDTSEQKTKIDLNHIFHNKLVNNTLIKQQAKKNSRKIEFSCC